MERQTIITVILIILVVLTGIQAVQLNQLKTAVSQGKVSFDTQTSGVPSTLDIDKLPPMVGGC